MDPGSWPVALKAGRYGISRWHHSFPYENDFFCTFSYDLHENFDTNQRKDRAEMRTTKEIILNEPADYVNPMHIIKNTTHRDGAIHRSNFGLLKLHRINERNESKYRHTTFIFYCYNLFCCHYVVVNMLSFKFDIYLSNLFFYAIFFLLKHSWSQWSSQSSQIIATWMRKCVLCIVQII